MAEDDDFFAKLDKKLTEQRRHADEKAERTQQAEQDSERFVAEAISIIERFADGLRQRGIRVDTYFYPKAAEIKVRYKDGHHYGLRVGFVHKQSVFGVQDHFSDDGGSYASEASGVYPPDYVSGGAFEKKVKRVLEEAITYSDRHGGFDKPQNF